MSIKTIPIRATINLGGLIIKTPYILSFNVNKVRNSKSTFSVLLLPGFQGTFCTVCWQACLRCILA